MIKQYFKQALNLIRQNKLLSCISILGTAFAIAMIMVTVILFRLKNSDYLPEVNRSRTLYVKFGESFERSSGKMLACNYFLSLSFIKECIYPIKDVEAVTAMATQQEPLSTPELNERISGQIRYTDTDYWKFFDLNFISGRPFSDAEFTSGIKSAVVNEETARKLFHTNQAVGKVFYITGVPYQVCGIIKDVSGWAREASADVYVPYTAHGGLTKDSGNLFGAFSCLILAHSSSDFDLVHRQVDVAVERFNQNRQDAIIGLRGQPYTHFEQLFFSWDKEAPHVRENVIEYIIILLVLLLVPAINLSGFTLSRMQQRLGEIGIRKSFGATRWQLTFQVLTENFILTLMGGVIGMIFSYGALFLMKDWLLYGDKNLTFGMLVSPSIFILTFLFCLVMNLLSAGIPAWKMARKNIVDALH